jgi:hypothetical protein
MSLPPARGHEHAFDAAKLVSVWAAWFLSLNWNAIAAFLSAVFTLLLILDKLGGLTPLKRAVLGRWRRPKHEPAAP